MYVPTRLNGPSLLQQSNLLKVVCWMKQKTGQARLAGTCSCQATWPDLNLRAGLYPSQIIMLDTLFLHFVLVVWSLLFAQPCVRKNSCRSISRTIIKSARRTTEMNSGNETSPAAKGSVLAGLSIRTSRCRELARTQEIKTHYRLNFRVS